MEILFIKAKRMYRYIDRSKAFKKAEITIKQKNWEPNQFVQKNRPDSGLYWNTVTNAIYDSSTRERLSDVGEITNADQANAFRDQWFQGSSTVDNQGNILQAGQVIPQDRGAEGQIYGNNYKNQELNTNPLLNDPSYVNTNGVRSFSAVPFGNIIKFIKENPDLLNPAVVFPLDESEKVIFDVARDQVINERANQFSAQGSRSAELASGPAVPVASTPTAVPSTATSSPTGTATATTVPPTATESPTATAVPPTATAVPTSTPSSSIDDPGNYYNDENFVQTLNAAISLNNALGTSSPTATASPTSTPTATASPTSSPTSTAVPPITTPSPTNTPAASVTSTQVPYPTETPQSLTDRLIDSARGGIRAAQNVFKEDYGGYLDSDKTLSDLSVRPTNAPSERKTPDASQPRLSDFPSLRSEEPLDSRGGNVPEAVNNASTRVARQNSSSTPVAEDVASNLLANQFASQGSRSAQQSRGPERTPEPKPGGPPEYGTEDWDKWARANGMTVEYSDPSQLIPPKIDYNKTEIVDTSGNWDDPDLTPTQWHPNTPPTVRELANNPDSTSNRIRATSQAQIDNFWNSQSNTPAASPTKTPKPTSTPKPTTTPLTRSFERKATSMTTKEPFFLFSHNTQNELTESEKYYIDRQDFIKGFSKEEKIAFCVTDDMIMLKSIIMQGNNGKIIDNWLENTMLQKGLNSPELALHSEWDTIMQKTAYEHYQINPDQYWVGTEESIEIAACHPVLYQTGIRTLIPEMNDLSPMQKSDLSRDEKIILSNIIGVSTESIDEKLSKSFMVNEPELMTNSEKADLSERQISASLSNNQVIDGLAKLFGISPTEAEQKIAAAQFHPFGGV